MAVPVPRLRPVPRSKMEAELMRTSMVPSASQALGIGPSLRPIREISLQRDCSPSQIANLSRPQRAWMRYSAPRRRALLRQPQRHGRPGAPPPLLARRA